MCTSLISRSGCALAHESCMCSSKLCVRVHIYEVHDGRVRFRHPVCCMTGVYGFGTRCVAWRACTVSAPGVLHDGRVRFRHPVCCMTGVYGFGTRWVAWGCVYVSRYVCMHTMYAKYVCIYVCMYLFMYVCLYVCMYACILHICILTKCMPGVYGFGTRCVHEPGRVDPVYVCVCVCMYVCMHAYQSYMHVNVSIHLCVHTYTYIHTNWISAKCGFWDI
jgi:hypothetical protein